MPRVLCTRPNASTCINGVAFVQTDAGMLSDVVAQDVADLFCECPGYTAVGDNYPRPEILPESDPEESDEPAKRGPGRPRKIIEDPPT